jgi:hypothetical protein
LECNGQRLPEQGPAQQFSHPAGGFTHLGRDRLDGQKVCLDGLNKGHHVITLPADHLDAGRCRRTLIAMAHESCLVAPAKSKPPIPNRPAPWAYQTQLQSRENRCQPRLAGSPSMGGEKTVK